jgi:hypothetical protein
MNPVILQVGGGGAVGFSLKRVMLAIDMVAKAAERESVVLRFNDSNTMDYPAIAQLSADLRDLIAGAMKNVGSLTVRYLGDLKPTVYPIGTQFFHLAKTTEDGGEFGKIIQKALLESDGQELTFVNLASVRDVKIHVGNYRAAMITDDLNYLTTFCETCEAWANSSSSICVEER